ncbi:FAD-dependent oxidoreductase [Candidatus Microgenomates bacterium]|nr:FAD-dependent oxidoreductase [Candidatus Microgenomates bacterium]
MKIAILGAGFTGLSAAFRLLQKGYQVTIFEKEESSGGLAVGFKLANWQWSLEKGYHHWFTNDDSILHLAKEINHQVIIERPSTDVFTHGKRLPFDSATTLINFRYLPIIDRVRVALILAFLKILPSHHLLDGKKALPWIRKFMGEKSTKLIWNPLFTSKFGKFSEQIALTWFWARIKKRTPSLAYPQEGFQAFADHLGKEIKKMGGEILLNTQVVELVSRNNDVVVKTTNYPLRDFRRRRREASQLPTTNYYFDKVIVTLPSPIFTKIAHGLPKQYTDRITSIPHLHAQVLILILNKPFMDKTYWLNITEKDFPFLILAEHTNFMDSKYYGGQHILYIGNYLPPDHPYLKMTVKELLKVFDPFLKKINPNYQLHTTNYQLFIGPFAQPIVTVDYPNLIPSFTTPLKGVYLANLDMVYPWDRGTNYAVELGEKIADMIDKDHAKVK